MPFADYNTNPALNNFIGSIYVGEGWDAPDVNNAFRQMMADAKLMASFSHATAYAAGSTQAKMARVISVTDAPYNAKGDGVTDDTAAIQAAVDAAVAANVDAVEFPETGSFYKMSNAVDVNGKMILHGNGVLKSDGTRPCIRLKAAGCTVRGLTFKGTGTYASDFTSVNGALVRVLADECAVTNCFFDEYRYAIEIRGCSHPQILFNRFTNGLSLSSDHNGIAGNVIHYVTDDSVHAYGGLIFGNHIEGGFGFGIVAFAEDSTSPTGSYTSGTSNGGIHSPMIISNTVKDGFGYGIYVYRRGGSKNLNVDNAYIAFNYVSGITGHTVNAASGTRIYGAGIYVQGAEDANVLFNCVTDCVQQTNDALLTPAGIGLTNAAGGVIRGNQILRIGRTGSVPTSGLAVGLGISVKNTNVTTANNAAGFGNDPEKSRVIIDNNIVRDTYQENIEVADCVKPLIRENTLYLTAANASNLKVRRSGSGAFAVAYAQLPSPVISGNDCSASTLYGIELSNAIGQQVVDNQIFSSADDSIRLVTCGYGAVLRNSIKDNVAGYAIAVRAGNSQQISVMHNTLDGGGGLAQILTEVQCRIRDNIHINHATPMRIISAATLTNGWWQTTDLDTTPDVYHSPLLFISNTAATTITAFDNAQDNTPFIIMSPNANTTLGFTGASLSGNGEANLVMATNRLYTCVKRGAVVHVDV